MFRSIYARLLVTYLMITVFILLLQSVLLVQLYKNSYIDTTADAALEQASQISAVISSSKYIEEFSIDFLVELLDTYTTDTTHIWLADQNTNVIKICENTEFYIDDKLLSNYVNQVFDGKQLILENKFLSKMSVSLLSVAVPVKINDKISYALFIHKEIDTAKGVNYTFYRHITLSALIAIIICAILVSVSSRHITQPIQELNKITIAISNGNFDTKATTIGDDEISHLTVAFNDMSENLKRQEELRSGFVANVSHELRSPITSIHGFAQGMLDGTIEEDKSKKYIQIIVDETTRLKKLISELLDLSQIESGEFPLHFTRFDINEQIRRVLIRYIDRIEEKDIELNVEFGQEYSWVFADYDRIEQILINLVDNAIKFTPENGTISLWTYISEDKVMIGVSDTGCGVDMEDLQYIFERFYKSDKARSDKVGTGLGLSIVKKILDQHGETIMVNSTPNKGTRFVFTLSTADNKNI